MSTRMVREGEKSSTLSKVRKMPLIIVLIVSLFVMSSCAHQQPTGADLYAMGLECDAAGRPAMECQSFKQRGIAQALRESSDGIDYGTNVNLNVH